MYDRRPDRGYRRGERKIYYPSRMRSPAAQPARQSRFRRRIPEEGSNSAVSGEKVSLLKRFRPRTDKNRQAHSRDSSEKRFRAHTSRRRSFPSPPAPKSAAQPANPAAQPQPEHSPERSYPAVYSYYPVPPAFVPVYPPPPPSYGFDLYDENGRRLSDRELDELNAREDYEDRYGRDFDHYADNPAAAPDSDGKLFPKNYLADTDEGS